MVNMFTLIDSVTLQSNQSSLPDVLVTYYSLKFSYYSLNATAVLQGFYLILP